MQTVKEKVSNAASSAKANVDIYKAKAEEKVERAAAKTQEEKVIAHEISKMKEYQAKTELHAAKAKHAAEKLEAKLSAGPGESAYQYGQQDFSIEPSPTAGYNFVPRAPLHQNTAAQPATFVAGYNEPVGKRRVNS